MTVWLYRSAGRAAILRSVNETQASMAEELPALYRVILDGVAQLEQLGVRREAALIRAEAARIYSGAWDARGRRKLTGLIRRVERVVAGQDRPRIERPRLRLQVGRSIALR
jgi:hypothetical protein